jgi:hypothetical protein
MIRLVTTLVAAAVSVLLSGCSAQPPAAVEADTAAVPATPAPIAATAGVRTPLAKAANGSARVVLTGEGIAVSGDFPASPCGGPYILGKGVVYQAEAEGWKITLATEERTAGDIALRQPDGDNQVIATVSHGDRHFVRKPSLGSSFNIGEGFGQATADLELGNLMGRDTLRLQASFDCG